MVDDGAGFGGGAKGRALAVAGLGSVALVTSMVVDGILGDVSAFVAASSVLVRRGRLVRLSLGEDILEIGGEGRAGWVAAAMVGGDVGGRPCPRAVRLFVVLGSRLHSRQLVWV